MRMFNVQVHCSGGFNSKKIYFALKEFVLVSREIGTAKNSQFIWKNSENYKQYDDKQTESVHIALREHWWIAGVQEKRKARRIHVAAWDGNCLSKQWLVSQSALCATTSSICLRNNSNISPAVWNKWINLFARSVFLPSRLALLSGIACECQWINYTFAGPVHRTVALCILYETKIATEIIKMCYLSMSMLGTRQERTTYMPDNVPSFFGRPMIYANLCHSIYLQLPGRRSYLLDSLSFLCEFFFAQSIGRQTSYHYSIIIFFPFQLYFLYDVLSFYVLGMRNANRELNVQVHCCLRMNWMLVNSKSY